MAKDAVSEWSSASPTLDFIWFKPPSCFCARLAFYKSDWLVLAFQIKKWEFPKIGDPNIAP